MADQMPDPDQNAALTALAERERELIKHFIEHPTISKNTNHQFEATQSFGDRIADRMAAFGGSWPFLIGFSAALLAWMLINGLFLARPFDPYPFILLNLVLSSVAALQAPIIMMSQSRQAAKDRLDATHDYEINLKAELEIQRLHNKIDDLRDAQWRELVQLQQEQIQLLNEILRKRAE
ncbi:DUF1003 domain-containing protein [Herpetosiphon llansteffanensis]|uniref:DUF1003 domain-containing protein n=1 Tax=Herpetosiphon llansteffanensis TaxID=2094568 RepID=UPI000D7C2FD6|nr:DUF1003 domain-containing protein [Herpetosiphon llansteffanensis]